MSSDIVEYKVHAQNKRWNRFFGVPSDSRPDSRYTVSVYQIDRNSNRLANWTNWACSCPRWTRNADRPECKHIQRVKRHILEARWFTVADTPESVAKFIKKFENAFSAVEIAEQPDIKLRKTKKGTTPFDLVEFD
jgi:hypothetical protein